jgi:tetratricopeptide (TPR) repeat protein
VPSDRMKDRVNEEPFTVIMTNQEQLSPRHGGTSANPSDIEYRSNLEAAAAFVALAEDFWKKGDRSAATEHYTMAHSIYISRHGDEDNVKEVAMVLKKLGDLNQEDGALDAAMELYTEALEMEMTAHGQHLPQTLNAAGVVCLRQDDFRSAMDFHRKALQIQKKSDPGGRSKYETYETLVNIGNVYYSERNNFSNIRSNGVDYREFIESGFLSWIALAHDTRGEYVKSIQVSDYFFCFGR